MFEEARGDDSAGSSGPRQWPSWRRPRRNSWGPRHQRPSDRVPWQRQVPSRVQGMRSEPASWAARRRLLAPACARLRLVCPPPWLQAAAAQLLREGFGVPKRHQVKCKVPEGEPGLPESSCPARPACRAARGVAAGCDEAGRARGGLKRGQDPRYARLAFYVAGHRTLSPPRGKLRTWPCQLPTAHLSTSTQLAQSALGLRVRSICTCVPAAMAGRSCNRTVRFCSAGSVWPAANSAWSMHARSASLPSSPEGKPALGIGVGGCQYRLGHDFVAAATTQNWCPTFAGVLLAGSDRRPSYLPGAVAARGLGASEL